MLASKDDLTHMMSVPGDVISIRVWLSEGARRILAQREGRK